MSGRFMNEFSDIMTSELNIQELRPDLGHCGTWGRSGAGIPDLMRSLLHPKYKRDNAGMHYSWLPTPQPLFYGSWISGDRVA